MLTVIVFVFMLSVLIVVHEFGHFIAARRVGVRVEKFSLGFGPQIYRKKRGQTEYCLSAIPLGGFVKLAGDNLEEYRGKPDEYFSKTCGERWQVIFFGPFLNYILGFLCFWLIFFSGYPTLTTKVGGLMDGFGANAAGLKIGDKILAVDGQKVAFWDQMQRIIQAKKDSQKVRLLVLREDSEFSVEVDIKEKKLEDVLGEKHSVGLLGITPYEETIEVRHGPLKSIFLSLEKTWDLTVMTYKGLWRMITGKLSIRESVTGPLGMFYITSKVARLGITAIIHLIAVLSVSLAIFNLLPLPVLDGGHMILLAIEKVRKKTLSVKAERFITQFGLTLIIVLAALVTYNDILKLFGDKITKVFK